MTFLFIAAFVPWSPAVMTRAHEQQRFVLIDLEAVWCHWCHVMRETTYADPQVQAELAAHYIAVRADQDATPELARRYEDYGWPATIVLAPDGSEIVRRRGYFPPAQMLAMLEAIVADPTPGPSAQNTPDAPAREGLSDADRATLAEQYTKAFDGKYAGWGGVHKYIDANMIEWALSHDKSMAKRTLDAALALIDPKGGMYQYSDSIDWHSPHYEKIMWVQADAMRSYALGYATFGDAKYLKAAQSVARYVLTTLHDDSGAFYTSQDADIGVSGSRAIDQHLYADQNALAIDGVLSLYDITGESAYRDAAERAARWLQSNRAQGALYRHGDDGAPVLGDALAVARAQVHLYASTGDRAWLTQALATGRAIRDHFGDRDGFVSLPNAAGPGALAQPLRTRDENISAVRLFSALFDYGARAEDKKSAAQAMRFLTTRIAEPALPGALLMADRELSTASVHAVVVGGTEDPSAQALFAAAHKLVSWHTTTEWWDRSAGPLPSGRGDFPTLPHAALFVCSDRSCSAPVREPKQVASAIARLR